MIKRLIFKQLQEELDRPEINILLGPRQVGKTTLLRELEKRAKEAGRRTCFFDLEQPTTLAEFNRSDAEIIKKIESSGQVVFIDEFQYIRNASRIFKAIFDSGSKTKLVCSGSSSLEIHKHLKESLAGRRFLFQIYPLCFSEIRSANLPVPLESYLRYGGMPALTHTNSAERKQKILSELLSAYILKDVKALVKEENIRAFNHLLYLLAQNQGSLLSIHSLANEIRLSSKSLNRYLDILETTFVNYRIYSFSHNLGNELKKSCKSYLYDLGIRNVILKDFSEPSVRQDKGSLLESFVFLKLRSLLRPNMEIKFWRTKDGDEVDFILLKDRKPIPIEVKCALDSLEIPKALKRFFTRYPKTETAYVVNQNHTGQVSWLDHKIHFITFSDFEELAPTL